MELNSGDGATVTFARSNEVDGVVVHLGGELDISNVDHLRDELETILAAPPERLIFDLAGLAFFDSSGIALFVEIAGAVPHLLLRRPSSLIRRIIEGTGLTDVLEIEE